MRRNWSVTAMLMGLSFLAGILICRAMVDPQLRSLEASDFAKWKLLQDRQTRLESGFYYDQNGAIRGPRRKVR